MLVDNLPGYSDNINRASDGNYWLAFVGLRSPVYDLAMADPGFRIRMVKQIPPDEWLCPGINYGCVIKFDDNGTGAPSRCGIPAASPIRPSPRCASTRAISISAASRTTASAGITLPERRPGLDRLGLLLGRDKQDDTEQEPMPARTDLSLARDIIDRIFFPNREVHAIPVLDGGVFAQPTARPGAATRREIERPTTLALGPDGALYVSSGDSDLCLRRAATSRLAAQFSRASTAPVGGLAWTADGPLLACVPGRRDSCTVDRAGKSRGRLEKAGGEPIALSDLGRRCRGRHDLRD